jgi:anthranilate phosphoribosyltransferase
MFLLAPALHPAMKRVMPVRRALGFRTIFNLAGPLTNPAGAQAQVMGVYSESKLIVVAEAMAKLGVKAGLVVHGRNGMDEIALSTTDAVMVAEHRVSQIRYEPEAFGLKQAPLRELSGGESMTENAVILEEIFQGKLGAKRDVVVINAAAALLVAGLEKGLPECVQRATRAIDSGAVRAKVEELREFGSA